MIRSITGSGIFLLNWASALLGLLAIPVAAADAPRPNIVFILADDKD